MKFNLSPQVVDNLKEYVIKLVKRELHYQEFWALRDVSIEIEKGDKLGILGLNGAGKSTLLKIIAGVMKPSEGSIQVKGKIVPLFALASGFSSDYTGRENIFLKGALLGYSKRFIEEKYDEIVEFSEIEEFIDVPLKNYSSGMIARLAFSIATMVEPDILILDEVLAVGDAKFQQKSQQRMKSFLNKDTTVLFVSHSIGQVRQLCNKAIWLDKGKVVMEGSADHVCNIYEQQVLSKGGPVVSDTDPEIYADNVPADKQIKITFNKPIKFKSSYIELKKGDEVISTLHSIDDNILIIKPKKPLDKATQYTLELHSNSIKDWEDNETTNFMYEFTTS